MSLSEFKLDSIVSRDWSTFFRDPDWRQNARFLDRLHVLLDRIPPLERDVLELYFFKGKREAVIARLLGIAQQTVSHRMYVAFRRIVFMMDHPEIPPRRMKADLRLLLANPFTVDVLCDFARTSSQALTAQHLQVPQQRVCWHLNTALRTLRAKMTLDAVYYVAYFENLMRHRNILVAATPPRKVADGTPARPDADGSEEAAQSPSAGAA